MAINGSQMAHDGSPGEVILDSPSSRISPSKYWCFTWNNYNENSMDQLLGEFQDVDDLKYICGFEVGTGGTPHIQGYIECPKKIRPMECFKLDKKIHWEKRKGNRIQNLKYCSKDNNYKTNFKGVPLKIYTIMPKDFYTWQKEIIEIATRECPWDDRSIYWYYDTKGNIGKTSICKYLIVHKNAILLSGKAADMKYAIQQFVELNGKGPDIILIDIPRTAMKFVSYTGIEEIKNGMFFSGKYEGSMVVFNNPHIICFSNSAPDKLTMSKDRWKIKNLDEKKCVLCEDSTRECVDCINSEDELDL